MADPDNVPRPAPLEAAPELVYLLTVETLTAAHRRGMLSGPLRAVDYDRVAAMAWDAIQKVEDRHQSAMVRRIYRALKVLIKRCQPALEEVQKDA